MHQNISSTYLTIIAVTLTSFSSAVRAQIPDFGSLGRPKGFADVSVSADGRYALIGRGDTLTLWDVSNRRFVRTLSGSGYHVRFSTDGRRFLFDDTATRLTTLRDLDTDHEVEDGDAVSGDGRVVVKDVSTHATDAQKAILGAHDSLKLSISNRDSGAQSTLQTSAGGQVVALSEQGNTLVTQGRVRTHSATEAAADVVSIAGLVGLGAIYSGAAKVGAGTGGLLWTDASADAALDGGHIDPGPPGYAPQIIVWDLTRQRPVLSVRANPLLNGKTCLLSADGLTLLLEKQDRSVEVYDLRSGAHRQLVKRDPLASKKGGEWYFTWDSLALSADGKEVARTEPDGATTFFDILSGKPLQTLPAPDQSADEISLNPFSTWFSPDRRFFATRSPSGYGVRVYEIATGRLLLTRPTASGIAFAAGGSVVLASNDQETPVVYELASGKEEAFSGAGQTASPPSAQN